MIIRKYGITLRRVTHTDIEIIRQGRNKESVRSKMLDQRVIGRQQQEKWFHSINNENNFYFIIQHETQDVGLIYGKNIDWLKKENEGGIFIWKDDCLGSGVPALASIILLQLCFSIADLERIYAIVQPDNITAHRYNLDQGYIFMDNEKKRMVLTRENYHAQIERLRWIAGRGRETSPLSLADIEIPSEYVDQPLPELFLEKWRAHIC